MTTKEILILIKRNMIMIIMNMQSKLYTILFFCPPNDWSAVSSQAAIAEPQNREFQGINEEVWIPRQDRIQILRNERERYLPAPWPTPIHKLSMTSVVWNISIGQLGCLSVCAPSQLLRTCSLAEYEKIWKKSLILYQQLKTPVLSTFFLY